MKRIAVVAVVVVGILLVGARLFSSLMERWYDQMLEENSSAGRIRFEKVAYEPGWWTTRAVTRVVILDPRVIGKEKNAAPIEFSVGHVLRPGPFVSGRFALAELRSAPVLSAGMEEAGGDPDLLEVSTQVSFGGGTTTEIAGEPFEGELSTAEGGRTRIAWKGAQGTIRAKAGGGGMDFALTVPHLSVAGGDDPFLWRAFTAKGEFEKASHGVWAGSAEIRLGRLEAGEKVLLDGIQLDVTQAVDEQDNASIRLTGRADTLRASGPEIRTASVTVAVDRVAAEIYGPVSSGEADFEEEGSQLDAVRRFLIRAPSLVADASAVSASDAREIRGRLEATFLTDGLKPDFHPLHTLVRMRITGDAEAPEKFVEELAEAVLPARQENDESSVPPASGPAGEIARLEKDGWLVRRDGGYATSFVYGNGAVVLNGTPRPDLFRAIIRRIVDGAMAGEKS